MSQKIAQLLLISGLVSVSSIGGTSLKAIHGEPCKRLQEECMLPFVGNCTVFETYEAVKACNDAAPPQGAMVVKKGHDWANACWEGCKKAQNQGWCKKEPGGTPPGAPCQQP